MPDASNLPPNHANGGDETDHLLPGEAEAGAAQAPDWVSVYEELLTFKEGLLVRAEDELAKLSPVARDDAMTDIALITHQAGRYRRRLTYWGGLLEAPGPGPG